MLLAAVLMAVSHAGAWLLAIGLQGRFPTGSKAGDVVGTFVLHALAITAIVLIAGSLQAIGVWGLTLGGILAGAAGIAMGGMARARAAAAAVPDLVRELFAG